jgi:hypothetical protein
METSMLHHRYLPLLARTTAIVAGDSFSDPYNPRTGGIFGFNVTAIGAAPSITPTIQGFDPVWSQWYNILVGTAITAIGYTVLKVYPGATNAANAVANDILPPTWRINIAVANADSITYGISAFLRDI